MAWARHLVVGHLPAGLWFFFFWLSTLLAVIYVGVPVLAVGVSVWWATFRARRRRAEVAGPPGPCWAG